VKSVKKYHSPATLETKAKMHRTNGNFEGSSHNADQIIDQLSTTSHKTNFIQLSRFFQKPECAKTE